MNSAQISPIVVAQPEACAILRAFGDEVTIHLDGTKTGGKFTMFTTATEPGGGPPLHYHTKEDEWFLVVDGRIEFFVDGSWAEVPVGSAVYVPMGTVHTFRNAGQTRSRMLVHTAPAGFEVFFARCAVEFSKHSPPDMQTITGICAEHGIYFVT